MDDTGHLHTEFDALGEDKALAAMDFSDIGKEIQATAIKGGIGILAFAAAAGVATYMVAKNLSGPKP